MTKRESAGLSDGMSSVSRCPVTLHYHLNDGSSEVSFSSFVRGGPWVASGKDLRVCIVRGSCLHRGTQCCG